MVIMIMDTSSCGHRIHPVNSRDAPQALAALYEVEPGLKEIAGRALAQKGQPYFERLLAYRQAKHDADGFLGWSARDPRLRSHEAWDCFFGCILDELNL